VGGYVSWTFLALLGLPVWFGLPLIIGVGMILGLVISRSLISHMIGKPHLSVVMMTLGLAQLLGAIVILFWGQRQLALPQIFPTEVLQLGALPLASERLWSFAVTVFALALFYLLFQRTLVGLRMRAVADSSYVAQSVGVGVRSILNWVWVIAGAICIISGFLIGSLSGVHMGLGGIAIRVFPVVLLAGADSITGVLVAGPIVGMLENLSAAYLDPIVGGGFAVAVPYILITIFFFFKPYGLFGEVEIDRV
jgi:branched-chain amino acid transport system permease protein